MQTPVSTQVKRHFIQWFLKHYRLKKRESVWILNYLMNHNNLLENVHFIHEARFCSRAVMMSTQCSEAAPFRFYKKHLTTTDADKSFHDIRLHQNDPLYIQLNFRGVKQNAFYAMVLESNPFIPEDYFVTSLDKKTAKDILDQSVYDHQKEKLKNKIDQALDENDRDVFDELVQRLTKLEDMFRNQPTS